jgi:hypothetical protein
VGFEEDMRLLQERMKQLETEYEQWFAGALRVPPWATRKIVENVIRRYNRNPPQALAEQSVFQMHQSKFNAYSEMWERRIRLKEEGRLPSGREEHPRKVAPSAPPQAAKEKGDNFRGVFDTYIAAKEKAGQGTKQLNYDNFRRHLEKQAEKVRSQHGYDVDFGVSTKDGKISLVARRKK